ncbi:hypothetical protein OU995_02685 [Roseateles sp. SL47]|uniref:hypothetical protein n=1 Tax=Roseateles sp. SL47 TaxID=2995138 RepID=UPI00226D60D7|nr:hypothetical protein [Roseateles sp. SL47]WAC73666.1 hypothetical protein OU995_02685 [Roseateles sp. SL47]
MVLWRVGLAAVAVAHQLVAQLVDEPAWSPLGRRFGVNAIAVLGDGIRGSVVLDDGGAGSGEALPQTLMNR